jgi:Tfp pilus assembly PilM family ATPase
MPEPEIDQAVRWEAGDRLGFDLTDGQLAYFRSGEVRRGTETRDEYLLFGATAATLRAHLALLAAAGLRARAIDLQPCAILRALAHQALLAPDAPAAVADLGHAGTQIMILQEGRLVFYKHVEIGEQALDAAVGQKLGVPPAEAAQLRAGLVVAANNPDDHDANTPLGQAVFDAMRPTLEELARELDMCLRYYGVTFRGNRPDVMHLVGGRHYCPRSLDAIAAVLGLRMEKAQPLRSVAALTDLTRPDKSGEWAAAMGLSLYPRNAQEVAA